MNDRLLAQIERELLGRPGVSKEKGVGGRGRNGFRVPPATTYRFGRRHLGHVHHNEDGLADFSFPKEVRGRLTRSARTIPHPAFPEGRTDASYRVRGTEAVTGAVELFRIDHEKAIARTSAAATQKDAT